jgi:hypothetical protein
MEGAPKYEATNEKTEGWENLKERAQGKLMDMLAERGLVTDIESAEVEQLEAFVTSGEHLLEALSYGEDGELQNDNRYEARELGVLLNKAKMKLAYEKAPSLPS